MLLFPCAQGGIRTPVDLRSPDLQSGAIDHSATYAVLTHFIDFEGMVNLGVILNL